MYVLVNTPNPKPFVYVCYRRTWSPKKVCIYAKRCAYIPRGLGLNTKHTKPLYHCLFRHFRIFAPLVPL